MQIRFMSSSLVALALLGLACGERDAPSAPAAAPPAATASAPAAAAQPAASSAAAVEEAKQIFATRCTTCHGSKGAGDGPGSAALDPKPRNFQDPAWQDSVTDEHLEKIVMYGGAAVGKTICFLADSAVMPTRSFILKFKDEFEAHVTAKACPFRKAAPHA